MKSKKLLSIAIMLVSVLGTPFLFSSCSKDDNVKTDEEQSIMVGKWKYTFNEEYGCYIMLTFNSDGTGTIFEMDGGSIDDDGPIYWSYEEADSILTIMYLEGGQITGKHVSRLTWINEKTFIADLGDEDSVWIKQ